MRQNRSYIITRLAYDVIPGLLIAGDGVCLGLSLDPKIVCFSARIVKLDDELLKFGKRFGVFGNEIPSMAEPFD